MPRMQRIAIKDIALNNDRYNGGKGSLEMLKSSIGKVGLINPITVQKTNDASFPYTIVAGRRRIEAVILLDWTEIDAVVYEADEKADNSYFRHLALAENLNRLDLHPLDEGAQYARLLKSGYTLDDLCAYFDRSMSHIYQRMKLNDLIQEIQNLFRKGKMKIGTTAKIASLPKRVQKEIYHELIKEQEPCGNEKTIDRIIGQLMRLPLDFPCTACALCIKKRTHYSNSILFPEYSDHDDYCMDIRCYEKNIRNFYQKAVNEFLKRWGNAKAVYIYEEYKKKAERLRSIFEKKPLITTAAVHVYHESFDDCMEVRILDEDETDTLYSFSSSVLKDCCITPVLYFQDRTVVEPVFYIAVDDATYEKLFLSYSDEGEQTAEYSEAAETNFDDTGADTNDTDRDNILHTASGAEQDTEERANSRKAPLLTLHERAAVFKEALLAYLRQERDKGHHPFFYSTVFLRILEERPFFEEAFHLVIGDSLQDFYRRKKYEDIPYRELLEIYVYSDIIAHSLSNFRRLKVVNNVPIFEKMGLDTKPWRVMYAAVQDRFLSKRRNVAPETMEPIEAKKKTAVTVGIYV